MALDDAAARERIASDLRALAELAERSADTLAPAVARAAELFRETLDRGGTLYFCGNGGSAADAQHIATEYVVRYVKSRRAMAAVALTTDTSLLTAAGNDFGFDQVFARQVEAHVQSHDLLVIHSTSGNSPNVVRAAEAAKTRGAGVVALLARDGGALARIADLAIIVSTDRTDRAQEVHLCLEHAICRLIEEAL